MVGNKISLGGPSSKEKQNYAKRKASLEFSSAKFLNEDAFEDYESDFSKRPLHKGKMVDFESIDERSWCLRNIVEMGCSNPLEIEEHVYEDLVRQFYGNMYVQYASNGKYMTVYSYINGEHIALDGVMLGKIFQLPVSVLEGESFYSNLEESIIQDYSFDDMIELLTYNDPKVSRHYWLLHDILIHTILPRSHKKLHLSKVDMLCIDHIEDKRKFNIEYVILKQMEGAKLHPKRDLPFGMMLTAVFKAFNVSLMNEERAVYEYQNNMYSSSYLDELCFLEYEVEITSHLHRRFPYEYRHGLGKYDGYGEDKFFWVGVHAMKTPQGFIVSSDDEEEEDEWWKRIGQSNLTLRSDQLDL